MEGRVAKVESSRWVRVDGARNQRPRLQESETLEQMREAAAHGDTQMQKWVTKNKSQADHARSVWDKKMRPDLALDSKNCASWRGATTGTR